MAHVLTSCGSYLAMVANHFFVQLRCPAGDGACHIAQPCVAISISRPPEQRFLQLRPHRALLALTKDSAVDRQTFLARMREICPPRSRWPLQMRAWAISTERGSFLNLFGGAAELDRAFADAGGQSAVLYTANDARRDRGRL